MPQIIGKFPEMIGMKFSMFNHVRVGFRQPASRFGTPVLKAGFLLGLVVASLLPIIPHPAHAGDLSLRSVLRSPVRVAQGPDARIYVSETGAGDVFIYSKDLAPVGQLRGVNRPLGLAVDAQGRIFVGSAGGQHIRIYSPDGDLMGVFAEGQTRMPSDMTFDLAGNLYVADSLLDGILVFDTGFSLLRTIGSSGSGDGQLRFPSSVAVAYRLDGAHQPTGEVFVADQGNFRVQVFDLNGNFLRKMGSQTYKGMSSYYWEGYFNTVQSLQVDDLYRLHAADCYMNLVQILDAQNGSYLGSYGDAFGMFGTTNGSLTLPLDIQINTTGVVVVANYGGSRIEGIYTTSVTRVLLSGSTVSEGTPTQTVVGVLSTDPPAASNLFMLVPGPGADHNALLAIDGSNLVTAYVLDRETTPSLHVRIKAVNESSINLMHAESLTIAVSNVNEGPAGVSLIPSEVWEQQTVPATVGTLAAIDPDLNDSFTFSLVAGAGDSGNANFSISGSNLITAAVLDYAAASSHSIRVRVDDSGGLSATTVLSVAVIKLDPFGDPDHDANGIPDWWEYNYTGLITGLLAGADSDADGVNNEDEWVAFTDPTDGSRYFEVSTDSSGTDTNGAFVLTWPGAAGRLYDVFWTTNLLEWSPDPIVTNAPATPPFNMYTDEVHAAESSGYYRIRVKLAP